MANRDPKTIYGADLPTFATLADRIRNVRSGRYSSDPDRADAVLREIEDVIDSVCQKLRKLDPD